MTKAKKRLLAFTMAVIMLLTPVVSMAQEETQPPESSNIIKVVRNYIKAYYKFDVTDAEMLDSVIENVLTEHPELFESIMDGIMNSLDEHSVYFTSEELSQFNAYIESEIVGIGAHLTRKEGYITVVTVLDGSPAQKAGLMQGDRIVAIDGETAVGLDTDMAVSKLRGEIGTDVDITVEREGVGQLTVTVTRDTIKQKTATGTLLEGTTIGYILLSSFGSTTSDEFKEEYYRLIEEGADRFIVDIRNNTGGVTNEACAIASLFIPNGAKIVEMQSKMPGQSVEYINTNENGKIQKLVLLVNEYSASASEILAAAIKDNNAGTLVGTKTYGKGTAQTMAGLGKYGAIKLTMAEFFGPNGETINNVGVTPHVVEKNLTRPVQEGDFLPFSYTNKFKIGDDHEEILAAKYRLRVLGYFNGTMDQYFDETLADAVSRFQEANNLFPYGELDFTTQIALNNMAMDAEITIDTQIEKAIEVVQNM